MWMIEPILYVILSLKYLSTQGFHTKTEKILRSSNGYNFEGANGFPECALENSCFTCFKKTCFLLDFLSSPDNFLGVR